MIFGDEHSGYDDSETVLSEATLYLWTPDMQGKGTKKAIERVV